MAVSRRRDTVMALYQAMLADKISTVLKRAARGPAAKMFIVLAALAVCVEVFASITWALSGAGSVDLRSLDSVQIPDRHPTQARALHAVSEWPPDRERNFQEAPQWARQVAAGRLPPGGRAAARQSSRHHPAPADGPLRWHLAPLRDGSERHRHHRGAARLRRPRALGSDGSGDPAEPGDTPAAWR